VTDWSKLHCGVHRADYLTLLHHLPDFWLILRNFPENAHNFTWDVKIHMLMPNQWPCIPNWHVDNVPRDENNKQDFSKIQLDKPMYLWLSGPPFTEFRDGRKIEPGTWIKFNQNDEHRGTMSDKHQWRCFIRATHKDILKPLPPNQTLRRHSQVYLDVNNFKW
jgi:hypothetical protein